MGRFFVLSFAFVLLFNFGLCGQEKILETSDWKVAILWDEDLDTATFSVDSQQVRGKERIVFNVVVHKNNNPSERKKKRQNGPGAFISCTKTFGDGLVLEVPTLSWNTVLVRRGGALEEFPVTFFGDNSIVVLEG